MNTLKELRHDASASKLLKIKSGMFIEQKELTIDQNTPTSRFTPNLNEAASYAAQQVLNRFNSHLPPKKPPSLLTKIAEFASSKKSSHQRSQLSFEKIIPSSLGPSKNHSRNPSFTSFQKGGAPPDTQSNIDLLLTASYRSKMLKSIKP